MPRPKGSKKDKTQSNKILLTSSSSHTSISSQTSVLLPNLTCSNDFFNDEINWIKTPLNSPLINKGGRPKKTDFITGNDESILSPTNSSSELRTNENRVVVNPAVLRYLEQNRNVNYSSISTNKLNNESEEFFDENLSMNINEENNNNNNSFDDLLRSFAAEEAIIKKDLSIDSSTAIFSNQRCISTNELIELDRLIQDDLFWDFCTCSTDFITSARLAEWILSHQQSAK